MRLRVQRHSPGASLGRHRFHDFESPRGSLARDGQGTVAIGAESETRPRVEAVRVDLLADGNPGNHLAGPGVQHGHNLIVASGEYPPPLRIQSHPGWLHAGIQCKAPRYMGLEAVDLDDFTGVFNIDKHLALAVGSGELRLPAEFNGAHQLARSGLEDRDILAAPVEGKHPF